jgi:putative toxin-antitoxin system antitoxin component (TIGR02293 family)
MTATARVVEILGGPKVLGTRPRTELDFVDLMRRGLPYRALKLTTTALGLTLREVSTFLAFKHRTLARRRHDARLTPAESERVVRLARVTARAEEVFADRANAHTWLRQPNRVLGDRPPIELLDTDLGAESVLQVLYRIEDGVYS